jgi:Ca-activated chloride channel family protein
MRGGRFVVIVIAVAAIAVAAVLAVTGGGGDDKGGGGGNAGGGSKPASDAIRVSFVYSPEKEALIAPLIRQFNGEDHESSGHPVFVDAKVVASGEAETKIAQGKLKPVAWSPASSLWGRLLNFQTDSDVVSQDNPSIVRTPLVIAMWEPLARALGWPKQKVGFKQILALALSKKGWSDYGEPQFGQFKLGHTNPDFSTSGLSAVAAEYFAATGKREGLTPADVSKPAVRRQIKDIERSIVHYGDTTVFFADQLKKYGPAYASAVAMEEATLVDFNKGRTGTKLVALYPREGTFYSDNPYIVLNAPGVSAQQKDAAGVFGKFLQDEITPAKAASQGFRPGDPDKKPTAPIDAQHGANPAEPKRVLGLPQPQVLDRIRRSWRQDRKPANVMLVLDTSGSMSEEGKLDMAKRGLKVFLAQLSPTDRVGLISFNDQIFYNQPVDPFSRDRAKLLSQIGQLFPGGETAVYDAAEAGLRSIQRLHDSSRINAVVVLTDGEDNQSKQTASELAHKLEQQARSEGLTVRVYTIAYGQEANRGELERIAAASGGKGYQGDTSDIESVYRSISSFF